MSVFRWNGGRGSGGRRKRWRLWGSMGESGGGWGLVEGEQGWRLGRRERR